MTDKVATTVPATHEQNNSQKATVKTKLRTARDIISRLRWSEEQDCEKVYVGYDDRMNGPMETPVASYKSIHDGGEIPEHRILYFRRAAVEEEEMNDEDTAVTTINRGTISQSLLWDKEGRVDRLFGSGLGRYTEASEATVQHVLEAMANMKWVQEKLKSRKRDQETREARREYRNAQTAAAVQNPATASSKKVDYLCVLDFEATCCRGIQPKPQEIIEFPTLLLNVGTGEVEQVFHYYIRPDVHPRLSDFCTELTGITQGRINKKGINLVDALHRHEAWLAQECGGVVPWHLCTDAEQNSFLYLTCGDWDLDICLQRQLEYHGRTPGAHFDAWINVKKEFAKHYNLKKAGGMTTMLHCLGIELEGRHHSGIDDCRNIVRICQHMLQDGWSPSCPTNYN